jgi:hypothetical protein
MLRANLVNFALILGLFATANALTSTNFYAGSGCLSVDFFPPSGSIIATSQNFTLALRFNSAARYGLVVKLVHAALVFISS